MRSVDVPDTLSVTPFAVALVPVLFAPAASVVPVALVGTVTAFVEPAESVLPVPEEDTVSVPEAESEPDPEPEAVPEAVARVSVPEAEATVSVVEAVASVPDEPTVLVSVTAMTPARGVRRQY